MFIIGALKSQARKETDKAPQVLRLLTSAFRRMARALIFVVLLALVNCNAAEDVLNVFVLVHTHNDVGWLKVRTRVSCGPTSVRVCFVPDVFAPLFHRLLINTMFLKCNGSWTRFCWTHLLPTQRENLRMLRFRFSNAGGLSRRQQRRTKSSI